MSANIICDACGKPIVSHPRDAADQPRKFQGQTIAMVDGISGAQSYLLDFHHACADRLLKAIGRERIAIKAEQTE